MTVGEAIRAATTMLEATSDTARLDAELLMAHALGASRSDMLLKHMRHEAPDAFVALTHRRKTYEPVAYITGVQEFYGREFSVAPGVLIPRPDSEVLIDTALELCPDPVRILDLGTGSGALLFTLLLERPNAAGVGVDASKDAIEIAQANAISLGDLGDERCALVQSDWRESGWSSDLGQFDLIICNPPYVEQAAALERDVRDFEPPAALFSGPEGLDDYRILIPQMRQLMSPGAHVLFEIGFQQSEAVMRIAKENGFDADLRMDLAGRPRCVMLR